MKIASFVKFAYLCWFSKPAAERTIYRAIREHRVRSIVELGVGNGQRARRMMDLCFEFHDRASVRYVGIDLFEARGATAGLTLKQAHRLLSTQGTRVQLMPGDPFSGLARIANSAANTDLILIAADQDPAALERAWFYVPRMLHDESLVLIERQDDDGRSHYESLPLEQVRTMAHAAARATRRAA